ncbi:hypothetical protein [Brevifollis gellanilyticus]|uniref:PepSY domain-containing protein n=1 Tax=Brevifollis gellanilyticus TaxID=748831 RepID=A0A512MH38_9BACT|nr:hypothetical protein [Brevifollis gellanilyticus]GEP46057.1 hypothetical protein BGE01nite_53480 [Brevifollis gellanilyticus]
MKPLLHASLILLATAAASLKANPEIPRAVAQSFGENVANNLMLVKGTATTSEPVAWTTYARDAFRPEEVLRINVRMEAAVWKASPAGAGTKILASQPAKTLDFNRLRVRSAEARVVAAKAAALAQTTFATVDYQLAANAETGAPEWGLALKDDTGYEVGFCVVSAETGALSFQDWTPRFVTAPATPPSEGERAAKGVKKTVRKAWNWTDKARSETRNFFRELFR